MKYRDLVRQIEQDGWVCVAVRGSHRQYKHKVKPGRVTIPGDGNKDVPIGALISIMKQAGLDRGKRHG